MMSEVLFELPDDYSDDDLTEIGTLPDDAGSLPANGTAYEPEANPPVYNGNGAG